MEIKMKTMETTGCGCQANPASSVDAENKENRLDGQGECATSCPCFSLDDPKTREFLEKFLEYPEGFRIESGAYQDISPFETYELIKKHENDPDFVVLDVRTENEFKNSRIPDSVLIDFFSDSFKGILDCMDRKKTYVVFCTVGGRSKLVMNLMEKMGFKKVYNVVGGEERWMIEEIPYGYPQNPAEWVAIPVSA